MCPDPVSKELNVQLQALASRINTLEKHLATQQALTQLMTLKNVAMMLASGAPRAGIAAALISGDPSLSLVLAGAGSYEALMGSLSGLAEPYVSLMFKQSFANLEKVGISASTITGLTASLSVNMSAAEAALAAAIAEGQPPDIIKNLEDNLAAAQRSFRSVTMVANAVNNLACGRSADFKAHRG